MFQNKYGEHDAELVRIAMHLASSLVGNYGYTADDADDILQILIVAGTVALPRFDPSKSKRSTFIYAALRERVKNLARDAERQKRDRRREAFSLNAEWPGDPSGDIQWSDVVGIDQTFTDQGVPRIDRTDIHGLRMDMEEALADLPPNLRELCRLHSHLASDDARRAAGMAKSTHHRAIKRIREYLETRGLAPEARKKSGTNRDAAVDHPTRQP